MDADPYALLDAKALNIPEALASRYGSGEVQKEQIRDACVFELLRAARAYDPHRVKKEHSSFHAFAYSCCARTARSLRYYVAQWNEGDWRMGRHIRRYGVLTPCLRSSSTYGISIEESEDEPEIDLQDELENALDQLGHEDRYILEEYVLNARSLASIGNDFGRSPEWTRTTLKRIANRFKEPIVAEPVYHNHSARVVKPAKESTQPEEAEGPMKLSLTKFMTLRDASLLCQTSELALQTYADLLQEWHDQIEAELRRLYPEEDHADQTAGVAEQV